MPLVIILLGSASIRGLNPLGKRTALLGSSGIFQAYFAFRASWPVETEITPFIALLGPLASA